MTERALPTETEWLTDLRQAVSEWPMGHPLPVATWLTKAVDERLAAEADSGRRLDVERHPSGGVDGPDPSTGECWYLSGPMTGIPEHNFPAFERAAAILRRKGLHILSPHELQMNTDSPVGTFSWSDYLRNDLREMLNKCHGIILLRGWPRSKGSRLELGLAVDLEWPVCYYDDSSDAVLSMIFGKVA